MYILNLNTRLQLWHTNNTIRELAAILLVNTKEQEL